MRIGVMADPARGAGGWGIACYVRELLRYLPDVAPEDEIVAFWARRSAGSGSSVGERDDRIREVEIPIPRRLLHRVLWPVSGRPRVERFTGPLDVIHLTEGSVYAPSSAPAVFTVYDLYPELHPERFARRGRLYRRLALRRARRRAAAVIAVSEATRGDLDRLGWFRDRPVVVTPLALSPGFLQALRNGDASGSASLASRRPYLFFCGRIDPRKNVRNLLGAFSILLGRGVDGYDLVMAGGFGSGGRRIRRAVAELGLADRVHFLEYLPQEDVVRWMRGATAFVYPSRHEGFGLPLLEAMACGVPIATSGVSSMPEVAGDAAVYWDPEDPRAIADTLEHLLRDRRLRRSLVSRGSLRVERFSWRRTAETTLRLYRHLHRAERAGRPAGPSFSMDAGD